MKSHLLLNYEAELKQPKPKEKVYLCFLIAK